MDNLITPLPQVTTGPLPASRKIYVTPDTATDLSVPLREIELSDGNEPPLRVYDTTGPYTDSAAKIDVRAGLPSTRRAWVIERGGVEEYDGRAIKPIDNGNVKADALRPFPNTPRPLRGLSGKPITQFEWARLGVITKEMIYVAERENLGRKFALDIARQRLA